MNFVSTQENENEQQINLRKKEKGNKGKIRILMRQKINGGDAS